MTAIAKVTEANMWQPQLFGISIDRIVFILVAVIVVIVNTVLAIRKKKKRPEEPPSAGVASTA